MFIVVSHQQVLKDEGWGRAIKQIVEIYVREELKRRGVEKFSSATIELFDNKKTRVYLEDEALYSISFKNDQVKKTDVGKKVEVKLEEIKDIVWANKEMDKNSAKVLIIRFNKDYWILNFDFRYNRAIVEEKVRRAEEFLAAAETLIGLKEIQNVLVTNLWSAGELIVDSKLLQLALMPNLKGVNPNHQERLNVVKKMAKTSNIFSKEFLDSFFILVSNKNAARYGGTMKNKYTNELFKKVFSIFTKEKNSVLFK